jgi:hypothetical protein
VAGDIGKGVADPKAEECDDRNAQVRRNNDREEGDPQSPSPSPKAIGGPRRLGRRK